jgi:two-component system, chemotaxis family, sensor kinase CheA
VVECFDLPVEQRGQRTGMLQRGGAALSWVRLTDLLQGAGDAARPAHLVVVQHEERRVALAVDAFRGTQQIVIKPLARIFRNLAGVSGCTILHSGRVALILDVETLLRLAGQTPTPPRLRARPGSPRAPHPETSA